MSETCSVKIMKINGRIKKKMEDNENYFENINEIMHFLLQ